MSKFTLEPTPLEGLTVVRRQPQGDARGFFERMYCSDDLRDVTRAAPVVQVNRARTDAVGTLRGMHFQRPPCAEVKIVSCLSGRIYDVAVDVRRDSPTFLQWFGIELGADDTLSLVIPQGFAHGYQTLEPGSEILYFVTAAYHAPSEDGLHPLDPSIGIRWPLPAGALSDKDRARPFINRTSYGGIG